MIFTESRRNSGRRALRHALDLRGTNPAEGLGVTAEGVYVRGWDVWAEAAGEFFIPRSHSDTMEKLLGKRGTIMDKHGQAREDVITKLRALHKVATMRRCRWDEVAMLFQLIARGIIAYAPLVVILNAPALRREDAALQRLVLTGLGVRQTAERMGLLVHRSHGGLQIMSVVECTVAAVAADLIALLNGRSDAAQLSRDALREAMAVSPDDVEEKKAWCWKA